jgi:hypothetical protein
VAIVQYTFTNKQYIEQHKNYEECGPCPVFASFTLALALQLRKKHGETSVRVTKYIDTFDIDIDVAISISICRSAIKHAASIVRVIKCTVKVEGTGSVEKSVHIYVTCCLNSRANDVTHAAGGDNARKVGASSGIPRRHIADKIFSKNST